jgi:hypothetical protein
LINSAYGGIPTSRIEKVCEHFGAFTHRRRVPTSTDGC